MIIKIVFTIEQSRKCHCASPKMCHNTETVLALESNVLPFDTFQ